MSVTQLAFFDGRAERDRIIAAFQSNHRTYLEALRGFARDIARRAGEVTVDDVRDECAVRDFPLPDEVGIDARVLGALFNTKDFQPIAQRPTTRKEWANRVGRARSNVTVYRLDA